MPAPAETDDAAGPDKNASTKTYPSGDYIPLGSSDEEYYLAKEQADSTTSEKEQAESTTSAKEEAGSTTNQEPTATSPPETPRLLLNGEPLMPEPQSPVRRKPLMRTVEPRADYDEGGALDEESDVENFEGTDSTTVRTPESLVGDQDDAEDDRSNEESVAPAATITVDSVVKAQEVSDERFNEENVVPVTVTRANYLMKGQDEASDDGSNQENIAPIAASIVDMLAKAQDQAPDDEPNKGNIQPVAITRAQNLVKGHDETSDERSNKENIAPVAATIVDLLAKAQDQASDDQSNEDNAEPVTMAWANYVMKSQDEASDNQSNKENVAPIAITRPKHSSKAHDEASDDGSNKENIEPVATTTVQLQPAPRTRNSRQLPRRPYPFHRRTAVADFNTPEWHSIDEPRARSDILNSTRDPPTLQQAPTQLTPWPSLATERNPSEDQPRLQRRHNNATSDAQALRTRRVNAWWRASANAASESFEVVIPPPAGASNGTTRAQLDSEGFSETEAWMTTLAPEVECGRGAASGPQAGIVEGLVRNPRSGELIEFQTRGLADGGVGAGGLLGRAPGSASWPSLLGEAWLGPRPSVATSERIESVGGFQHSEADTAAGSVRQTVKLLGACARNKVRFWRLDFKVWYGQLKVEYESRQAERRMSKACQDLVLFEQPGGAARRQSKADRAVSRVNGALHRRNSTLLTRIEGLQNRNHNIEDRLSRLQGPYFSGRYTIADTEPGSENRVGGAEEREFASLSELSSFDPVIG